MSNQKMIEIDDSLESTYLSSKFRFTIDNIPELRKLYPPGKEMVSDVIKDVSQFMTGDVFIHFYPCGNGCADPNYCSLFLIIQPKHVQGRFYVKYSCCGVVDGSKNDLQHVFQGYFHYMSRYLSLYSGRIQFIKLVNGDRITESLTVEFDMEIFTRSTYLRWLKLYPELLIDINSDVLYQTAIDFNNQDYDDNDNKASIGVIVDGKVGQLRGKRKKVTKLFSVSKDVVCNVSDVFKTRLTGEKWEKGKVYEVSGYDPKLVNKFLKSIHTGILRYDDWEDLLYLLEISNEYQVIWIKNEACQLIENGLKIENGIQSFIRADLSDAKELRKTCLEFCMKNCQQLKLTDEWKEFKKNHNCLYMELIENVSNVRI